MKLKFTFLITALLLLGNLTTWGQTYTWNLVTDVTTLAANDVVIIAASGYNFALSTTQNGNNRGRAEIDKDTENNTCTFTSTSGVQELILKTGTKSGTLAFNDEARNGYLYAASSGSNWLRTETNLSDNSSWVITISDGVATITAQGTNTRNILKYNPGSSIFSCYASGQQPVCLYKKAASGPTQLTAPTDFSGTPGNGQIAFSWTAVENASSYLISCTPTEGDELTQTVTGGTTNSYTFTGLTNDIVYSCKIKAVGDGETYSDSDYSTAISVEPTDATLYSINLTQSTGGTITCDKATAEAGETITLTATPADGYGFTSWTVLDGDANEITVTDNQFTMPASNVEVEATFTAYTISATSNDLSLGSVSLSGNVITATAATGCRINAATPYEVTVGTATVTQNDNEFTVVATSNCTVQINFEVIPTYTVTFNAGTGTVSPTSLTGATVDLSSLAVTSPTGWTFYGWATASVEATQTTPTIISGIYTPTDNITLYAVYSMGGGYTLVGESDVTAGTYIIGALRSEAATDDFYFATSTISSGDINTNTTSTTIAEVAGVRSVSTLPADAQEFAFVGDNSEGFTIGFIEDATTRYLGYTSSTTNRRLAFGDYSSIKWNAIAKDGALLTNGVSLNNGDIYKISENSTSINAIRGYYNATYRAIYLFKKSGTYNTNPAANGPCATPTFSLAEGYYYTAQSVVLSCETTGATIRYTTDGTEPTAESTEYGTEPIAVSTTTTIKAKAYCNGYDPSAIATATYNFMPDVAGTYVIAYKDGENYYAMSQTANDYGEKLTSQTVNLNEDGKVLTSVNGGLLWTIANTTSGVAIKPYNTTNYLNIGSSTLTISTTEDYFQVIASTEGSYNFKDISSVYYVEYYESLFTGYAYNETYASAYNLYLLPYELPITYTISIAEEITNGSISSEITSASEGDEITVTVNPDTDYKLSTLYYYTTDPATTTAIDPSTRTFTMPAADVTIGATFEPILYWHITLSENGVPSPTLISVQQGLSTILPASENVPDGYTFVGWSTSAVDVTNTEPELVATEYTPSADVTLYAVYAAGNKTWNKVYSALEDYSGDYLIVYEASATDLNVFNGLDASNGNIGVTAISAGVIADGPEIINGIITIASMEGGYSLKVNNGTNAGKYMSGVNNDNKLIFGETESLNTISINSGTATITSNSSVFQFNKASNNLRFRYYSSGNQQPVSLYKKTSNLSHYTTTVDVLAENTVITTNTTYTNPTSLGGNTLTIQSGVVLTAINGLSNTNPANLIIEDGGQLIINNAGVQATAEKNIVAWTNDNPDTPDVNETSGWYSISSPVKGLRLDSIFGAPQTDSTITTVDLYSYDEPTYTWKNYHRNSISESTLIPGKGYLTANASLTTREFVGELNNGEIIVNLSYESTHAPIRGFNFVGNPYLQDITLGNQAIVSESVATGYYKLVDGVFLARENDITIAPKEGFFVRATAVDQTITFNNAPSISKDRANKDQYISIEVNNNTYMDRAYAMFSDVIGLAKVSHLDENAPMVYIPQNGTDYAIASYTDDVNEIPLCFKTPTTGYYTINMKPQGEFNYIHLFDKVENVEIDMLNRGSYEFIGSPKDMENRFTITLNRVNTPNNTVINNFAFISNDELVINNIEGEGTIQIIDIVGRIASQYIVSGSTRISMNELSKGVYMVRLIDNSGSKTQKIVVK